MSEKIILLESRRCEQRQIGKVYIRHDTAIIKEFPAIYGRHLIMALCGVLVVLCLVAEFSLIGHHLSHTEAKRFDVARPDVSTPIKPTGMDSSLQAVKLSKISDI